MNYEIILEYFQARNDLFCVFVDYFRFWLSAMGESDFTTKNMESTVLVEL